ncbi:MAG: hypothetical protein J0H23_02420 [Micrococcales bacterium]|nr:hypothetical protein [Micrococcales bacterium]
MYKKNKRIFEKIAVPVQEIARRVLSETMELPYVPEQTFGLDLEAKVSTQLAPPAQLDMLNVMKAIAEIDIDSTRRVSNYGALQSHEDRFAHARLVMLLEEAFPGCLIAGEEATPDEWRDALHAATGVLVFIVDPCDGTSLLKAIRSNNSVNIGVYLAVGDGLLHLLGSVSTSATGECIVHDTAELNTVELHSRIGTRLIVSDGSANRGVESGTIATVAARGVARGELQWLFDTHATFGLREQLYGGKTYYGAPLTIFTVGGAPVLISFPLGGCEYVLVPHDQTVWDAFPLLAALAAGGCSYVLASTGKPVTMREMLGYFDTLVAPGGPGDHPIPSGLLIRDGANPTTTNILIERMHEAWKTANLPEAVPQEGIVQEDLVPPMDTECRPAGDSEA